MSYSAEPLYEFLQTVRDSRYSSRRELEKLLPELMESLGLSDVSTTVAPAEEGWGGTTIVIIQGEDPIRIAFQFAYNPEAPEQERLVPNRPPRYLYELPERIENTDIDFAITLSNALFVIYSESYAKNVLLWNTSDNIGPFPTYEYLSRSVVEEILYELHERGPLRRISEDQSELNDFEIDE